MPFDAQDAGGEPARLAAEIADQAKALATDDCGSACKALASMRRSVERLCELEEGIRCEEARKTLADAERKVSAACPACVTPRAPQAKPGALDSSVREEPAAEPARAPRGCGGCEAGTAPGDASMFALATAALLARLRRRRRP